MNAPKLNRRALRVIGHAPVVPSRPAILYPLSRLTRDSSVGRAEDCSGNFR